MRRLWLIVVMFFATTLFAVTALASDSNQVDRSLHVTDAKVEMYGASWCGFCNRTRSYLEQNNIDYVEFDVEKDPEARARFEAMGGRGYPLTLVDGEILHGLKLNELGDLLDI